LAGVEAGVVLAEGVAGHGEVEVGAVLEVTEAAQAGAAVAGGARTELTGAEVAAAAVGRRIGAAERPLDADVVLELHLGARRAVRTHEPRGVAGSVERVALDQGLPSAVRHGQGQLADTAGGVGD